MRFLDARVLMMMDVTLGMLRMLLGLTMEATYPPKHPHPHPHT